MEPDIQQKIKFAKFHALRIVKALKAGEDPNLSNPKQEEVAPALDPDDPEVQALNGEAKNDRQPSVVEAPDETDTLQARLARQSSLNESIHPSRAPSAPPPNATTSQAASRGVSPLPKDAANFYNNNNQNEVSPISPDRKPSVGGNYFPRVPSPTSAQTLPSAPNDLVNSGPSLNLPSAPPDEAEDVVPPTAPSEPGLPSAPTTFAQHRPMAPRTPLDSFQAPPTPGQPSIAAIPTNLPQAPPQLRDVDQQPRHPQPAINPYQSPMSNPSSMTQPPSFAPPPSARSQTAYAPASQAVTSTNVQVDEEAMMKAQKHARWAISALNFEDVSTAIKEFELALQQLGAR